MVVSETLRQAVKLSHYKQYQLAGALGIDRSVFSTLINGITRVRLNDPRVCKLADLFGIPSELAFAEDPAPPSDLEPLVMASTPTRGRP